MRNILIIFFIYSLISIIFSCQSNRAKKDNKRFTLLAPERTGVQFKNSLKETHRLNVITYQDFYSGGGVAIGDINGDDLPDLFLTGNMVPSRLYLNLGDLKFKDITQSAGLSEMGPGWYTGTTMVDINNDGLLDIFIGKSGLEEAEDRMNLLYVNQGDGTFLERGRDYGLDDPGYAVNATFFDYDNDGDLDMYLVNQGPEKYEGGDSEYMRNQVHRFAGDKLFENIGEKFIEVTQEAGIYSSIIGFAHGVAAGDINNDGWEDLFVSNDFFEHDYIYINNGDKTFREITKSATRHISYYSMGNDMADFNNDGLQDIVVLDMVAEDNRRLKENLGGMDDQRFNLALRLGYHYQYMFNVLHLNNGNETFSEIGHLAGVATTDWSWAPLFADFDNDGWKDLYVTNGFRKDIRNIDWGEKFHDARRLSGGKLEFQPGVWDELLSSMPSKKIPNYMFKNEGDLTFSKIAGEWGLDQPSFSNGVAFGDLDNDGDLDLVVNNIDDFAFLYENNSDRFPQNHYLRLKLIGNDKNRFAIGSKARIYHNGHFQYQQHYITRGYRSSMEPVMHFGLGKDSLINRLEVVWPDGSISEMENLKADQEVTLHIDSARKGSPYKTHDDYLYFSEVTGKTGLDFKHTENPFDDYMREPLLPYRLSRTGPALAVADINGDGFDDFYIGGARGFAGAMYINEQDGSFSALNDALWDKEKQYEDTGASFFDVDNDGDPDLYVVSGGNEYSGGSEGLQDRLYINDGKGNFYKDMQRLPPFFISGSCAVPGDYDKDGDLDLFVGGRMKPGNYPLPSDSYLLENRNGRLHDVTGQKAPELRNLGMVTAAVWLDSDQDNDMDLVVTGEWMPIMLFENREGILHRSTDRRNGLMDSNGWWYTIAAEDLDQDGDPDLIAGNLGLNYKYKASLEEPFEIYYGNFLNNPQKQFILAYHQENYRYPVSDRISLISALPELEFKFPSNDAFSSATLAEIFSDSALNKALHYEVYTFATSYFENQGNNRFTISPLDNRAQISNMNSIIIEDIDGDGYRDIIMAGNLYSSEVKTIRNDAGIGTLLMGNGKGSFEPVPNHKSGLYATGNIKNMKLLKTPHENYLLCARNNDFPLLIRIIPQPQSAQAH